MVKLFLRILPAVALTVFGADPAPQTEQAASFPANTSPLPTVGTLRSGIEFAGETVDGDFSALVPLHSTFGSQGKLSGSLIFAEPYAEWVERGSVQAGLGLGFRHLFGQQPLSAFRQDRAAGFLDEGIYIGANVFLDMADTRYDQRFWQLGIGAEIGSRYLDLRGRYHIPLDDGEQSRLRSVTTLESNYDLNYRGARYVASSKVTIDSLFTFLTEGLEGWDAEASVLVPGLDRWVDLRLIGGYASFHSPTFDYIEYDTWKAGVEFRPVPAVVLSGMWFENERLLGDNWLFGIGLELPFETADIGDGKGGFWGHIKDAFKPRRRHLAERLVEPARRGALPMQIGTGLESVKTQVKYQTHAVWILPDGTVVTVASTSGSASSTTTAAGSISLSGAALHSTASSNSINAASETTSSGASLTLISYQSEGVSLTGTTVVAPADSGTTGTSPSDLVFYDSSGNTVDISNLALPMPASGALFNLDLSAVTSTGASFNWMAGDLFNLMDWASAVGNGTTTTDGFDLPTLDSGLSWDTSQFISHGTIGTSPTGTTP